MRCGWIKMLNKHEDGDRHCENCENIRSSSDPLNLRVRAMQRWGWHAAFNKQGRFASWPRPQWVLIFFCHLFLFQTPQQPCEAETACSRDAVPISYCGFCSPGGDVLPSREKWNVFPRRGIAVSLFILLALLGVIKFKTKILCSSHEWVGRKSQSQWIGVTKYFGWGYTTIYVHLQKLGVLDMKRDKQKVIDLRWTEMF